MKAGKLKYRCEILKVEKVKNDENGQISDQYISIKSVWCSKSNVRDGELIKHNIQIDDQIWNLEIWLDRHQPVTKRHIIKFDNQLYNIINIKEFGEDTQQLTIQKIIN